MITTKDIYGNLVRLDKLENSQTCWIWDEAQWKERRVVCHSQSPFGDKVLYLSDGAEVVLPQTN